MSIGGDWQVWTLAAGGILLGSGLEGSDRGADGPRSARAPRGFQALPGVRPTEAAAGSGFHVPLRIVLFRTELRRRSSVGCALPRRRRFPFETTTVTGSSNPTLKLSIHEFIQ